MLKGIMENIKEFFRRMITGKQILRLQEGDNAKESIVKKVVFKEDLKEKAEDRIRLLNLQEEVKDGIKQEEELETSDVKLLKNLYCEQILSLKREIEQYQKKLKET